MTGFEMALPLLAGLGAKAAELLRLHVLSIVVFLPFATAVALVVSGGLASFTLRSDGLSQTAWKVAGLAGSTLTLALAGGLLWRGFDPGQPDFQFVERYAWLPQHGIHYLVGLDGISLILVLLTTFLVPIVLLASWREIDHSRRSWVFFVLALETAALGALTALNLFAFYLFLEAMTVPMFFIIGIWGAERRQQAAAKYFVYTAFGSLVMLLALLVLIQLNFEQGGAPNLDLMALEGSYALPILETAIPQLGDAPWWRSQHWLFLAFAVAFGIKAPLVPFHTWLPDTHAAAPAGGSVLLAGILLEMGAYGFLRLALPLFPVAVVELLPWLSGAAVLGIVYGSLIALVQRDVKALVAYTSIAHLGFVTLGIFSVGLHGLVGSVVGIVSHALATGGLFLLIGFVYERRGTRQLSELGGLAKPMPVFSALFVLLAMASAGVPFSSGFVAELLVLLGSFAAHPAATAAAVFGAVLLAVALLRMLGGVVFGPIDDPANRGLIDLDWRERSVALALVAAIVWIGVYPEPLLRRAEPAAVELLATMRERGAELPTDGVVALPPLAAGEAREIAARP